MLGKHSLDNKIDLMNRKKKIIELHKKKWKKTDKRLQNSKKEKYVSKADRAKLGLEADITEAEIKQQK